MTMTSQPTLEVPAKIAAGIASGIFRRDGGVVRWADSGRILCLPQGRRAKRRSRSTDDGPRCGTPQVARHARDRCRGHHLTAAAAGAYTYLKKRRAGEADVPENFASLNASLRAYLDAAESGASWTPPSSAN